MAFKEEHLTQEFIKECFTYRDDGYLIWNKRPVRHFSNEVNQRRFNTQHSGTVAGYFNKRTDSKQEGFGYWRVGITREGFTGHFKLHRLIWLYHYGYLPEVVDHEDNDTSNNRIGNLRKADHAKNSYNLKISVNNTTGFKGVSYTKDPKRWKSPYVASIEYDGYTFGLGHYSDPEMAALAYNLAAEVLFKDFNNPNVISLKRDDLRTGSKFFTKTQYDILNGSFDWSTKKRRKQRK